MSEQLHTPSLLTLHSKSHKDIILNKFDTLRKRQILCDITLIVEDVHFKAHKALLAASSEYFSLMFTAEEQACQTVYRLDGMAAKTFASVLEFIYCANVSVEESSTEQLLDVARLLEISELVKAHSDFQHSSTASAPSVCSEVGEGDTSKNETVSKRKRGRPRKNTNPLVPGLVLLPQESSVKKNRLREPAKSIAELSEPTCNSNPILNDSDDADYEPSEDRPRHGKRQIRQPVKLKSYKLGEEIGEGKVLGKRGRKRKYPATEPRCDDCGKVFKNHLFLKIHQRTHTGEKPFRCHVCGNCFTQKHTLLVHQRMHTGEKPFVCNICSKALSTKHSLQEHMNLHAEKKSFSCDQCGKTYSQKRQLNSHYRLHSGKALPECAYCHHKFKDAAQLKKHLRTHTGEKPFTCEICGKCFTTKSTLQTHIRIHRGEKPYVCNICSKSFSDPSARRRHVASHTGKKPYMCSVCSLSFTRLDNLKAHIKTHNKERPDVEGTQLTTVETMAVNEKIHNVLELQQYQVPGHTEQEIQLVVTSEVDNINLVAGQKAGSISIISGESGPEEMTAEAQTHSSLTVLSHPSAHIQNLALVTQDELDPSAQIQTISVVEGQVSSEQAEQMHVITLTKEAMEHFQVQHGAPQQLQINSRPLHPLQVIQQAIPQLSATQEPPREQHNQSHTGAIHISSQASLPISISQTSEQIPNTQIQGQTFQIQAGTVSYLYTTSLTPQN
ncbi:zinc finger and BTB domain-containing protein 24 [Tachysurus vachellii]|uniref:zinc finger and BTB domain-containing protein 24 n=1 Tax=Tachysurus vachellii TaxID=175792 RepID=UPI00296AC642|nr:zinc finger and BTB domain-containing protein 24 [Tachysurus vachellii]XP_060735539.1 zinc finger and BTB domain-containing protein 24 [Tachysurus vachellii]